MINFCQLNIGQLSRNRYWGEDEKTARRPPLCVSSLLWNENSALLIDPCVPIDKMDELIFNRTGKRVSEVTALFFTHPHGDHTADADKYTSAELYVAQGSQDDWDNLPLRSKLRPFPDGLLESVRAVPLPGHTAASAGLAFNWNGRLALIAGDAVMTRDFFINETGYFNSADFDSVTKTIKMIKSTYDFVIPGHDILIPVLKG